MDLLSKLDLLPLCQRGSQRIVFQFHVCVIFGGGGGGERGGRRVGGGGGGSTGKPHSARLRAANFKSVINLPGRGGFDPH